MADSHQKGAFQADIPANAVEEALRSVEKASRGDAPADGVALEVEAPAGSTGDATALADQVTSLEAQLELSQAKARETLERLKDTHERYLRAAADLENYKKRALKEKEEIQKFGAERLLKDLLPVVDGLDRALAAAAASEDPLRKGVELVRASLEQTLGRHGVKGFSALGQPFDPARHEALLQVPTAEAAPGTVVLEHARGFTLNDRLARPAMVGVAVAPPSSGAAPDGTGSATGGAAAP
jgi:molecular chaperone GrpE